LCLFIACGIGKVPVESGSKAILPFIGAEIFILMLVTYVPWIVLALPRLYGFVG